VLNLGISNVIHSLYIVGGTKEGTHAKFAHITRTRTRGGIAPGYAGGVGWGLERESHINNFSQKFIGFKIKDLS
jgi:hypothetical protein